MNTFGNRVRDLRTEKGLLLREVAAYVETDTALMSKIERGERKAQREQVVKMAEILEVAQDELLVLWLADKVSELIKKEPLGMEALNEVYKSFKK